MPFVTVLTNNLVMTNPVLVSKIERACKDAWVSMNELKIGVEKTYQAADVGGVVIMNVDHHQLTPEPLDTRILFQYIDRGEAFEKRLFDALNERLKEIGRLFLLPTKPEWWFADPSWTVLSCTRPHKNTGCKIEL